MSVSWREELQPPSTSIYHRVYSDAFLGARVESIKVLAYHLPSGVMVHDCNLYTQEVEAAESEI